MKLHPREDFFEKMHLLIFFSFLSTPHPTAPPGLPPSASPGPSVPERPSELTEQFEELPETEISFVSLFSPPPPLHALLCLEVWAGDGTERPTG